MSARAVHPWKHGHSGSMPLAPGSFISVAGLLHVMTTLSEMLVDVKWTYDSEERTSSSKVDANGNGFISVAVLHHVFTYSGVQLSDDTVVEMLRDADVDGEAKWVDGPWPLISTVMFGGSRKLQVRCSSHEAHKRPRSSA